MEIQCESGLPGSISIIRFKRQNYSIARISKSIIGPIALPIVLINKSNELVDFFNRQK